MERRVLNRRKQGYVTRRNTCYDCAPFPAGTAGWSRGSNGWAPNSNEVRDKGILSVLSHSPARGEKHAVRKKSGDRRHPVARDATGVSLPPPVRSDMCIRGLFESRHAVAYVSKLIKCPECPNVYLWTRTYELGCLRPVQVFYSLTRSENCCTKA